MEAARRAVVNLGQSLSRTERRALRNGVFCEVGASKHYNGDCEDVATQICSTDRIQNVMITVRSQFQVFPKTENCITGRQFCK